MTTGGAVGSGLDQVFADALRALAAVRGRGAADDAEPREGIGTAREEAVRAVVQAPGRLTSLEIEPRLMRLPSQELTEEIMSAVNAALDQLRSAAPEADGAVDLDALSTQLDELQYESVRQLGRFMSGISGAVEQIRARRG